MPLKVKTVTEREFQGAELPRIFAEGQKLSGNRFLNLFFEKIEHKKIEPQNRMLAKDMEPGLAADEFSSKSKSQQKQRITRC